MSELQRDKLRKTLRRARAQMHPDDVHERSAAICAHLASLLSEAEHVAGYYAFGNEVDLSPIMNLFSQQQKQGYVPIVLPEFRMQFAPVDAHTPVTLNRYGIKEPQVDSQLYRSARDMDAVLVPLVGFDESCNRMGMGGGYYDRCFAHRRAGKSAPVLIGVAYELQRADTVYAEDWDVPLDHVVTESRIIDR